jgi:hypothetical protein
LALALFSFTFFAGLWLGPILDALARLRDRYGDWNRALVRKARSEHRQRNHARWTLACVCIAGGAVCQLFQDWVVWQVVPVPWLGFAGIAAGLFWVSLALTDR